MGRKAQAIVIASVLAGAGVGAVVLLLADRSPSGPAPSQETVFDSVRLDSLRREQEGPGLAAQTMPEPVPREEPPPRPAGDTTPSPRPEQPSRVDVRESWRSAQAVLRGPDPVDAHAALTDARGLVVAADGIVEGPVADAILHLLRDRTNISRCFVVRGVAYGKPKRLDPRVVERMVEIARVTPFDDPDCGYFFYFLVPHLDPRPSVVVDLALEKLETTGPGQAGDDFQVQVLTGDETRRPLVTRVMDDSLV
jgi:hypothetical protein